MLQQINHCIYKNKITRINDFINLCIIYMKFLYNNYIKKQKIVLIQLSPPRTGSTVLINILYGLLYYDKYVKFDNEFFNLLEDDKISKENKKDFEDKYLSEDINIIKTHCLNIDLINKYFNNKNIYKIYFICSERDDKKIDEKYYINKNVIIFDYDDLLETEDYTTEMIVKNVKSKLINNITELNLKNINLDENDAINRIKNMNTLYEYIMYKPFTYYSNFFHLHGSHRNRNK